MNPIYTIRAALIHPQARPPSRKHPEDAGLDIFACETVRLAPQGMAVVPTGVKIEIPAGYMIKLWAKSRSGFLVGAGVVDSGYQGEIKVRVFNPTAEEILIEAGEAVAQAVILHCETPQVEVVSEAELFEHQSARGESGGIHL